MPARYPGGVNAKGPLVLAGLSLALFGVGAVLLWRQIAFGRRAARAEGVVVDARLKPVKKGPSTYEPVVEYVVGGRARRFTAASPGEDWPRRSGEKLPVLYDPEAPERAALDDAGRYVPAAAWALFGLAGGIAALLLRER